MAPHKPTSRMPGEAQPTLNRRLKGARKARREALGLPKPDIRVPEEKPRKLPKHQIRQRQLEREKDRGGKGHICRQVPCFSFYHKCNRPTGPRNNTSKQWLAMGFISDEAFQSEQKRRMEVLMPSKKEFTTYQLLSKPQSMTRKRFEASISALQAEEIRKQVSRERENLAADIRRIGHATCSTPGDDAGHEDLDGQDGKC